MLFSALYSFCAFLYLWNLIVKKNNNNYNKKDLITSFILLLCSSTIFGTTNWDTRLRIIHSHLGSEQCASLLGFRTLTGCDQQSKVAGYTKKKCLKVLVDVSPDGYLALRSVGQCEISDEI